MNYIKPYQIIVLFALSVLFVLFAGVALCGGTLLLSSGVFQATPTKMLARQPARQVISFSTAVPTEPLTRTPTPISIPTSIQTPAQPTIQAQPPASSFSPESSPTITLPNAISATPTSPPTTSSPSPTITSTPFLTNTPPPLATNTPAPESVAHFNPSKGIVLAYPEFCQDLDTLGVGWYFTNEPSSRCPLPDLRFVPRLYGSQQAEGDALEQAVNNAASSSGWLLTFVEPNLPWHGNLSPEDGAKAWRKIEERAIPAGVKLVAPTASQHNPGQFDPLGYTWVWHMVDAYNKLYGEPPHFDAMSWNFYSPNAAQTRKFLETRREEALHFGYDVPFWVVEYAGECWNHGKGNDEIMQQITRWFQETSWIDHYAWFTHRINPESEWAKNHESCSLLDPNSGQYTELGRTYAGF